MKKITVSANQKNWSILKITKLVNKIGNSSCEIDIVSSRRYVNMKSICSLIEFCEKIHLKNKVDICVNGQDEEEVSSWLQEYFKD